MLDRLYIFLLNRPMFFHGLAGAMWRLGSFGLLAGVIAAASTSILQVVTSFGGVQVNLQQLLPGLPTWWIPQSLAGVAFYLGVLVVAYLLKDFARVVHRLHKY